MKRLAQVLGFALLTAAIFFGALAGSSRVRYERISLLQGLTKNLVEPGGRFQSLRRFREAEHRGHVDIAFLGASHTYRGFDPRIFAAERRTIMNLGSTNQTPINAEYVAKRYLPGLSPRVVVIEVAYETLSTDGLESTRDLVVNTPWSWSMERMALATFNLGAIAFTTAKGLRLAADESAAQQEEIDGETYVSGGYCESRGARSELVAGPPVAFELRARQFAALAATTEHARSLGARVVWVTLPVPRDFLARIADRAALARVIEAEAARAHVPYWDFTDALDLDPLADFKDVLHLNARGVEKLDRALLARLPEME